MKKQKIHKKLWVVFEHGKKEFLLFIFQVLMLLWFVFCVFGKVAQVFKMLVLFVFPVFLALWGGYFSFIWVLKV